MSRLIWISFLLLQTPAWAVKNSPIVVDFEDLEVSGTLKAPHVLKSPPSSEDMKRLSELVFEQFEHLILDIEPQAK